LGNLAAVRTPNELGHTWSESGVSSSWYAREVFRAARWGTGAVGDGCRRGSMGATRPVSGSSQVSRVSWDYPVLVAVNGFR
jgi:hypothetical protein